LVVQSIAGLAINPIQVFWTLRKPLGSFCVFGPVLSSPAHAAASLAMPLIEIEVVWIL
jgi:hypothetical protein